MRKKRNKKEPVETPAPILFDLIQHIIQHTSTDMSGTSEPSTATSNTVDGLNDLVTASSDGVVRFIPIDNNISEEYVTERRNMPRKPKVFNFVEDLDANVLKGIREYSNSPSGRDVFIFDQRSIPTEELDINHVEAPHGLHIYIGLPRAAGLDIQEFSISSMQTDFDGLPSGYYLDYSEHGDRYSLPNVHTTLGDQLYSANYSFCVYTSTMNKKFLFIKSKEFLNNYRIMREVLEECIGYSLPETPEEEWENTKIAIRRIMGNRRLRLENEAHELAQRISDYERSLMSVMSEYQHQMDLLNSISDPEDPTDFLFSLIKSGTVQKIKGRGQRLEISLRPLVLKCHIDGSSRWIPIGHLDVKFNFSDSPDHFAYATGGTRHPYLWSSGRLCYGDLYSRVAKYFISSSISEVIDITIEVLTEFTGGSPAQSISEVAEHYDMIIDSLNVYGLDLPLPYNEFKSTNFNKLIKKEFNDDPNPDKATSV